MASVNNEAETFQHYQVLKRADGSLCELGRGAMGITYKAFDTNLRCNVALKVINALHLDSETARARFLREARAAAGLRHRNVASVYHLGNDDQSFFYAMEFVDGQTVEELVKRDGQMDPREALQIVVQVARALGAAAKQGLVHRDIKPANLMVMREDEDDEGYVVKVIDFGLARPALGGEGSAHITMGGFVGTPQYASPEQLEEKDLDARSDIYSLGITLWYMLASKPPFSGPLGSVFIQQLTKEPPWDHLANTPEPVKALLAHMLQKDPDHRQQTPVELRREIETALKALPAPIAPIALPKKAKSDDEEEFSTSSETPSSAASATASGTAAGTDTPILAADSDAPNLAVAPVRTAAPGVGSIVLGRYELKELMGEGNNGRVFRALDIEQTGRTVALKVLHPDVLSSENERLRVHGELEKMRVSPHPNLLEVYGLEEKGDTRFVVYEWINGFNLVDLLRARGQLPPREACELLAQAAATADYARAHELRRIELGLHQILANFPTDGDGGDSTSSAGTNGSSSTKTQLTRPLAQWPQFELKFDALGLTREAGDSVTWSGDKTLMPATPLRGRDTQTSIRGLVEGSDIYALGLLTYELLSGAPPAQNARDDGRETRYVALPALSEAANMVLRRALSPNPGFTDNTHFFRSLMEAAGLAPIESQTDEPTASALTAAPVEEISASDRTLAFDRPGAVADLFAEQDADSTLAMGDGQSLRATFTPPEAPAPPEPVTMRDSAPPVADRAPAPVEPLPPAPEEDHFEQDSAQTVMMDSPALRTPPPPPVAKAPEPPPAPVEPPAAVVPPPPAPAPIPEVEPEPPAALRRDEPLPAEELAPAAASAVPIPPLPDEAADEEADLSENIVDHETEQPPVEDVEASSPLVDKPLPETDSHAPAHEEQEIADQPELEAPAHTDRADISLDHPAPPAVAVTPAPPPPAPPAPPVRQQAPVPVIKIPAAEPLAVARKEPATIARTPVAPPVFEEEQKKGSPNLLMIVGGVVALAVVGGGAALFSRGSKAPDPVKPPVAVVTPSPSPAVVASNSPARQPDVVLSPTPEEVPPTPAPTPMPTPVVSDTPAPSDNTPPPPTPAPTARPTPDEETRAEKEKERLARIRDQQREKDRQEADERDRERERKRQTAAASRPDPTPKPRPPVAAATPKPTPRPTLPPKPADKPKPPTGPPKGGVPFM